MLRSPSGRDRKCCYLLAGAALQGLFELPISAMLAMPVPLHALHVVMMPFFLDRPVAVSEEPAFHVKDNLLSISSRS